MIREDNLCVVGEVVMRDDKLFSGRLVLLHLINLTTTNYVIYFPAIDTAIIIIHKNYHMCCQTASV